MKRPAAGPGMNDALAPAPVVVFCYKRPDHLARTISSLVSNPEAAASHLTLFCDAAKSPADAAAVDAVRRYVDSIEGFASVNRVYRQSNMGLAHSIIDGVSRLLRSHDRVIVLEDDLLLSPHFLDFMNQGLRCYQTDDRVASIHGYCYPVQEALPETFFMRGADCWGWATWARAWAHFEPDGQFLLQQLRQRKLLHDFDLDGSYLYSRMLRGQIAGRNDSWAIRWHASCYLRDMLTLYPGRSLVENIGNDASGTHCALTEMYSGGLGVRPVQLQRLPLEPSSVARSAFVRFFRGNRESLLRKAVRQVSMRLKELR